MMLTHSAPDARSGYIGNVFGGRSGSIVSHTGLPITPHGVRAEMPTELK